MEDIAQLERDMNYHFNNADFLQTALTHSSYIKEHNIKADDNERLEFLGDAFFDAVIGEELFRMFPDEEEGFLSRTRATIVCEKSLANEAKKLKLGGYVLLGHGEEGNGGRDRESILADTMEAILGAVYIDGGFSAVKTFILGIFGHAIEDVKHGKYIIVDYKTTLQEKLQSERHGDVDINYSLIKETGPDHDKTFFIQLEVNGEPMTKGKGKSKKQAEQEAAKAMLEKEK